MPARLCEDALLGGAGSAPCHAGAPKGPCHAGARKGAALYG